MPSRKLPDVLPDNYMVETGIEDLFSYLSIENRSQKQAMASGEIVRNTLKEYYQGSTTTLRLNEKLHWFFCHHYSRLIRYEIYVTCLKDKADSKQIHHLYPSFEFISLNEQHLDYWQTELSKKEVMQSLKNPPLKIGYDRKFVNDIPIFKLYIAQAFSVLSEIIEDIKKFDAQDIDKKQNIVNVLFSVASLSNDVTVIREAIKLSPSIEFHFSILLATKSLNPDTSVNKNNQGQQQKGKTFENKLNEKDIQDIWNHSTQQLRELLENVQSDNISQLTLDELVGITKKLESTRKYLTPVKNIDAKTAVKNFVNHLLNLQNLIDGVLNEDRILQLMAFWELETELLSKVLPDSTTLLDLQRALRDLDKLAAEYSINQSELDKLNANREDIESALDKKPTPPIARELNKQQRTFQLKIGKYEDSILDKQEEILSAASPHGLSFDYDKNYVEPLNVISASDTSKNASSMVKMIQNLILEYKNNETVAIESGETESDDSVQEEPPKVTHEVLIEEKTSNTETRIEVLKPDEPGSRVIGDSLREEAKGSEEIELDQAEDIESELTIAGIDTTIEEIVQDYFGDTKQPCRQRVFQENVMWSMIDHGQSLIAYWFLKSMESALTGDPELPSSYLLYTAAIAPYVINIHGAAASLHTQSIINIDTDHHLRVLSNNTGCAMHCISIAATLQPCMFNPFPVTAQILRTSAGVFGESGFSDILIEIADIADRGQSFTLEDFVGTQTTHDLESALDGIQKEIEDIRKHVSRKKSGYYITNVITKEVIYESELEPIVTIVGKNKTDKANISIVRDLVTRYSTRESLSRLLEKKEHQLAARKAKTGKIIGSARNYFITQCSSLISLAAKWLKIHQNRQHQGQSKDKIIHAIERLLTVLPKTISSIDKKSNNTERLDEHAGLNILGLALDQILCLVKGKKYEEIEKTNPETWINLPKLMMGSPIDIEGSPLLANALARFALTKYNYLDWAQTAISARNIKLANEVCKEIERLKVSSSDSIEQLKQQIDESSALHEEAIATYLQKTDRHTEEAFNAGLLNPNVYADCKLVFDLIRDDIEPGTIEYRDFSQYERDLEEIDVVIQKATKERLEELVIEWEKLREEADRKNRLNDLPDGWEEGLQEAIESRDVTITEEYIQQFRDFLVSNAELFDYRNKGQVALVEFLAKAPSIYDYFTKYGIREAQKSIRNNNLIAGIEFNLVKEKPTKALNAIESLSSAPRKKLNEGDIGNLVKILRFIGFKWPPAERLVDLYSKAGNRMLMVKLPLIVDDGDSPVPSFGSIHELYYPVALIWKYRNPEEIGQFLQQHNCTTGVIVLFLAPLSPDERVKLAVICHKERLTLMILDPVVILFLSGYRTQERRETVLCSAFKVCLPFTYDNPYVQALYPPPKEMVYGRQQEIDRVMRPNGVAILYGGRQLGKSTILKEAESRLHRPNEDSFAFYFSVDSDIGRDLSYEALNLQLWNKIANKLYTYGLFKKERFETAPDVSNALRELMSRNKNLRITIFLDESDNLLNIDSLHNFALFRGFREHFYDSSNRFRVVIAGLQNVQRFSNMPNNPLNQLGGSLPVKILPSSDAIRLIRNPLAVLGFGFKEMTSVNRILAYTNNHAGLIQLFCHYLLEYLNNQIKNGRITVPGYEITEHDIEQTYQTKDIREGIVDRFQLTLRLDPRYRVLAYGFILDEIKLNYFNVKEAKDIGDAYWPEEFRNMSMTKLRAILEEMVGLGVLIHQVGDQNEDLYRFRNTNVFHLLGSEVIKRETIKEITEYQNESDPMLHHRLLEINNKDKSISHIYSSLTLGDELELLGQLDARQTQEEAKSLLTKVDRPIVTIASIYGSDASGFKHIKETLPWLSNLAEPDTTIEYRLMTMSSEKAEKLQNIEAQLEMVFKAASEKRIIQTIDMPAFPDDVALYTEYLDYLYSLRSEKPKNPVWIILLYNPEATWHWLNNQDASEIEGDGIHIILSRWQDPALIRLLNDQNMLDGPQQIKFLREKTGGWYELIKLFSDNARSSRTDDPEKLSTFINIVDERRGKIRLVQHALKDIGLDAIHFVAEFLKTLIKENFANEIQLDTVCLFVDEYDSWGFSGKEKQLLEWLIRIGVVSAINSPDGTQYSSINTQYQIEPLTQKLLTTLIELEK